MKSILLLFFLFWGQIICAQIFDVNNSISRIALVYYSMDSEGLFHKTENVNLQKVSSIISTYGYNKKSHELYVTTEQANCIITVSDELHKVLKKSKSIPQLNAEELLTKATEINDEMERKFENANINRKEFVTDSIHKSIQDSIRRAKEDSIRIVEEKEKEINYKKCHRWFCVPTKQNKINCVFCDKKVETSDSILCYNINNDSIYWSGTKYGKLYIEISHIHLGKIPDALQNDKDFIYHCKVYNDSLSLRIPLDKDVASLMNDDKYLDYLKELKKTAPNGLFIDWGWNKEYSNIIFNFRYMNTNKNTIKYIEVFFVVTNDVGDVRKTGSFKGTGPLEEWESASWDWDHSIYYVAGDATKMNISKVIITYMNGAKVTIPKNKLLFN